MLSWYLWSKKGRHPRKDKDILLVVEQQTVSVRRSTLIQHSAVFRRMAENGELKKSKKVKLRGVTATALQKVVEYIGSDAVYFQSHHEAIDTLRAVHLYQVTTMDDICANFLVTATDSGNVCDILEFAASLPHPFLEYHCLRFIDRHAGEVLTSASFLALKQKTSEYVLGRQSLDVSSEILIFRGALAWAANDCLRRGVDPQDIHEVLGSASPLLCHVRFVALSEEELSEPDVERVLMVASAEDSSGRRSSSLSSGTRPRFGTVETTCRKYVTEYDYELETLRWDDHAVKSGESFHLAIEVLKGRVFLTGVELAFEKFVGTKNTSCLYAGVSATNVQSADQRCARGTFMNSGEEAVLRFPAPLVARELERVEVVIQVKRAVNICSVRVKSDVQIAMPEKRDVAMKILPNPGTERSIFKSVKYFY